ncbi:GFA family protein [Oricola cellulosilytica]|uniref:GFA family protein n=1 Tax=Oricola cellulosilytica TaxID=1429082 RepID=A0A4R0PEQ1_9HYPH|nr:GFA family protein [Oricola cellulosilytica]TCD16071.1 GFA family protein [Oricola cellulosilytica]
MKITGRCHCEKITYEADVDPTLVGICHCTDCQKLSGSPYRVTAPTKASNVRILSGEPTIYVKTAQSGRERLQAFCGRCGSQLYTTGVGEAAKIVGLRWGSIDQRAELTPKRQVWRRSAAPWCQDLSAVPVRDDD